MARVITAIEPQNRRRDRVNVFVDDAFALSLSAIVAERAGLSVGSLLDDQDLKRLAGEDTYQRALDSALNFLSYRPRSEREVRQNLVKKRTDPDVVERVIARLAELRLLDDKAFAQFWQENRQRCSPRGPRAIKVELLRKGVQSEIIEEVLAGGVDQEQDAYCAAQKRLRSLQNLDYQTFRQRLGGHLLRRGFGYEVVATTVRRIWREMHGEQPEDEG